MSVSRENNRLRFTIQDGPDVFTGCWPLPGPESPLSPPGVIEELVTKKRFKIEKTGEATIRFACDDTFEVTLPQRAILAPWSAADVVDLDILRNDMQSIVSTLYQNERAIRDELAAQVKLVADLQLRIDALERSRRKRARD